MFTSALQRSMLLRVALVTLLSGCFAGCSNLIVRKVPLADRAANKDIQHGFRYYLNRPYLVVKKPIFIAEKISLVRVEADTAVGASGEGNTCMTDARLTFLDGPRKGQSVRLADLRVESPASGKLRPVSPAELQRIAQTLAAKAKLPKAASTAEPEQPIRLAHYQDSGPRDEGARIDVKTDSLSMPQLTQSPAAPSHAELEGDMEILYLPDLDEQYVINPQNCFAKNAFGLTFQNGSELLEVHGEHDSTTLALALLQQLQGAIKTAQEVAEERIQRQTSVRQAQEKSGSGAALLGASNSTVAGKGKQPIWQLIERVAIRPGVYRLNKPWEVDCGPGLQPVGCGFLAKLGLPTVTDVDFCRVAEIEVTSKQNATSALLGAPQVPAGPNPLLRGSALPCEVPPRMLPLPTTLPLKNP